MERNRKNKKTALTFEEYFAWLEELLKLTGRKVKNRSAIPPQGFKL